MNPRRTVATVVLTSLLTVVATGNVGAKPPPIAPTGTDANQSCLMLTIGDVQRWQLGLDDTLTGRC